MNIFIAPYHIYTHRVQLVALCSLLKNKGFKVFFLLPFVSIDTYRDMSSDLSLNFKSSSKIKMFPVFLVRFNGFLGRLLRSLALLIYALNAYVIFFYKRPSLLILTSDLGGVSVRLLQYVAIKYDIPILTLQCTLFLPINERLDLKYEYSPKILNWVLSQGFLKRLFLYFGEVPGSYINDSWLAVTDDIIRNVCCEFGKPSSRIFVIGSLQADCIYNYRRKFKKIKSPLNKPIILLLSECVEERYGMHLAVQHLLWFTYIVDEIGEQFDFVFRFHPRETHNYKSVVNKMLGSKLRFDYESNPAESVALSDIIIGSFSMLLFDAQAAGLPVIFLDVQENPVEFYESLRQPLAKNREDLMELIFTMGSKKTDHFKLFHESSWSDRVDQLLCKILIAKTVNANGGNPPLFKGDQK